MKINIPEKKDQFKISNLRKVFIISSAKEIIKLEKLENANMKGISNLIRL
jgi:hypothetical protein